MQREELLSLKQTKPVFYAFKVLNSQETRFHYSKRMEYFFKHLRLPGADLEEQGLAFITRANADASYAEECIVDYFDHLKQRVKNHQLAAATLRPLIAPIKLFAEMHRLDKSVSWKIIVRGGTTIQCRHQGTEQEDSRTRTSRVIRS